MKKKYLIIGSLAFYAWVGKAQQIDNNVIGRVNKTTIEIVYNHYIQDGAHSAVTGGKGTEELTVYGPGLTISKESGNYTWSLNMGADVISSASTDKIDYVMSSASKIDTRSYLNFTYGRTLPKRNFAIGGGLDLSVESDYLSIGSKLSIYKENSQKTQSYSAEFQMFNDDLRWGRLHPGVYKPVKLIYPSELRYKEWFDEYRRNSFNLKFAFTQVLNKRNIFGIFPVISYQNGLLSTPFHRVYFSDGSLAVEQLPNQRLKGSLALRLNSFAGGQFILKNTLNTYADNWGLFAFSIDHETSVKIKSDLVLLPGIRFYKQNAIPYFNEYGRHEINSAYYTSDFDLSKFESYNAGVGIRFKPFNPPSERIIMDFLTLRYNFTYRSDGLTMHIFSVSVASDFYGKEKDKKY